MALARTVERTAGQGNLASLPPVFWPRAIAYLPLLLTAQEGSGNVAKSRAQKKPPTTEATWKVIPYPSSWVLVRILTWPSWRAPVCVQGGSVVLFHCSGQARGQKRKSDDDHEPKPKAKPVATPKTTAKRGKTAKAAAKVPAKTPTRGAVTAKK